MNAFRIKVQPSVAAILLCGVLLGFNAGHVAAEEVAVRLTGSLSPLIAQARPIGPLDKTQDIEFGITLPLRNEVQLNDLLTKMYTPGDPLYRRYLKTGEFAERFGPTQADYDTVIAFATKSGLRVTDTHANRAILDVAGPAGTIEKVLGLHMLRFQSPEGRIFRGPDAEPAFPAAIAPLVAGVVGLDDAVEPKSNIITPADRAKSGSDFANGGSGPGSGLSPSDIKTAYNLNGITETGGGQSIALFELDGYYASDITAYEDQFGLPHVTLQNVLLNNVPGTPTAPTSQTPDPLGPQEVTLDIELAIALAPGIDKIIVYEGTSYTDLYNRIASDNAAEQVSTSWYYGLDSAPSTSFRNAENTAFLQMASQGQSFYAATGDYGSSVRTGTDGSGNPILQFGVQDPSAQPFCCAVGGTTLTTNGAGGAYTSETAWSGSGGGISTVWTIPGYQCANISAGSGGSSTLRNLPDVALNSNTGYSIYHSSGFPNPTGGWSGTFGGTSCAAPLWAAYTALVNQHRLSHGLFHLGFPNLTIYYLAQSSSYLADFHDITTGNNGTYPAVGQFDNVTGWGTFNGGVLFNDLLITATEYHVDGNYNGTQMGTVANPYKTVGGALNAAAGIPSQSAVIYINGNNYPENLTINQKALLINNGGGVVHIGN